MHQTATAQPIAGTLSQKTASKAAPKARGRGAGASAARRVYCLAAESYNQIKTRVPVGGGASLTFEGVAMPTLDDQRVARLAYYHVQGFSFFRSFDRVRRHGRWMEPSKFLMLGQLINADWGNTRMRHFMAETALWEPLCLTVLADGYFQHMMRKKPDSNLLGLGARVEQQVARLRGLW